MEGELNRMRSLYQCMNTRCDEEWIYCTKRHSLVKNKEQIGIHNLERGDPLIFRVCQDCLDYDEMGGQMKRKDRGWLPV